MDKLRECPFCGGEAELIAHDDWGVEYGCRACGFEINKRKDAEARAAWNRRATPPASVAGDGLREAAEQLVAEGTHAEVDRWGVCVNPKTCWFCVLQAALSPKPAATCPDHGKDATTEPCKYNCIAHLDGGRYIITRDEDGLSVWNPCPACNGTGRMP